MTIKDLLMKGMTMLKLEGIDSPKLKSRLLLQHVLDKPRDYLIIYDREEVDKKYERKYLDVINKVIKGTPIQHLTHSQEFMKMSFYINENVLVPRPDTEILAEEVINIASRLKKPVILDLCTGSGAIAISLANNLKNATVFASDVSKKALRVAKINARKLGVENKVKFIESDMFKEIKDIKFDIIVSNPPYIPKEDIKKLDIEVQNEPLLALDGGKDGLNFYRTIFKEGYEHVKYKGYICVEIGYNQKIDVIEIIENEKKYVNTYSKRDLYGKDRIVITKVGD